ncbi:MAG: hypothetical protein ACE5NJ_08540 [Thermodesulfobacteriota bacterium]
MLKKLSLFLVMGFIFIFIFTSCEKKPEVTEAPETEEVTVALTSSRQEIKGELFDLGFSDLKIIKTVDTSTKKLTTTPSLKVTTKISNNSTNILDIKGVTIQYLDSSGNPIPFKDGKEKATVSHYMWSDIQPGKDSEKPLEAKVPMVAVKEKSINKIRIHVVYVPAPLKKESMDLPVKMEK